MRFFWFSSRFPLPLPFTLTHPIGAALVNLFRLARFLIIAPPTWIFRLTLMLWFIFVLLPGFLQVAYYYLTSPNILRNVQYGPNARNFMDIYLPITPATTKPVPVVIFLCGGVWIIGYKAWGALMGRILAANGILSIMPDYRNFPQGTISDMLLDVDTAIQYTYDTLQHYGGDRTQVTLAGQSAGAHLALMALFSKAKLQFDGLKEGAQWNFADIRRYIGISGPYDIGALEDHFHRRGLYRRILRAIFEGGHFGRNSPTQLILRDPLFMNPEFVAQLPEIFLFHGTGDTAVPESNVRQLYDACQVHSMRCHLRLYKGKSHTDPIIEDLMHADDAEGSDLMTDIISVVSTQSLPSESRLHTRPSFYEGVVGEAKLIDGRNNLVPKILVYLARKFNPF